MRRNIGLDILRVCSVLYIVGFWHLLNYTKAFPDYDNIVTFRIVIIVLGTFVFISGFLIGSKSIPLTRESLAGFYRKRLLRIYPLYLVALVAFFFLGKVGVGSLVKGTLLIAMFCKPAPLTLWFITMLMVFYSIAPFLIHAVAGGKDVRLLTACAAAIAMLLLYWRATGLLDVRIIVYFPPFLLGIYAANGRISPAARKYLCVLAAAGAALSFLHATDDPDVDLLFSIVLATFAPYVLFETFRSATLASKSMERGLLALSYASYCMYLFHRPLFTLMQKVYFPTGPWTQLLYLYCVLLPGVMVLSYAAQKAYDRALALHQGG